MCRTEERDAVDERAEVGFFLRRGSRGRRGTYEFKVELPSLLCLPSTPLSPGKAVCLILLFSLLPSFISSSVRCRPVSPVNVASHVVSKGFCESADDCRRVIRRFLA